MRSATLTLSMTVTVTVAMATLATGALAQNKVDTPLYTVVDGYKVDANGKKQRIAKRSGEVI